MSGQADMVLVPHTHWDREWYEPFQVFRLRLVSALDTVIDLAEADAGFRFTIDGQMAAVEDYLEIRPENRDRLAERVGRGQIAVGPWYILLDEFLCSGETIVRNLELGWEHAGELGEPMSVGYLPDMFGHCAQMPQILARAGIAHACLWRGVPASVDSHAFSWTSPDGSSVRVEYLFDGYGNGLDPLAVAENVDTEVRGYRDATRSRFGDAPVLGMYGTDHMPPRPDLMSVVDKSGGLLAVATLDEYLANLPPDAELPQVEGELRSHARGNILPGVISVRVGLKQAMARAERMAGQAESLAARTGETFDEYRRLAWRRIVECTAHDSVTGCGVDDTADQVEARLAEATQAARAVRDTAVASLASAVPSDAHLVANPLGWHRTGLVELDVETNDDEADLHLVNAGGERSAVQELETYGGLLNDETLPASEVVTKLMLRIHGRELYGRQIETYDVSPGSVTFHVSHAPTTDFDITALRDELTAVIDDHPGRDVRVRIIARTRRRVLAQVPVAGSGQVAVRTATGDAPELAGGVSVRDGVIDSVDLRVEVDAVGTLTITGADGTTLRGVGRIVSGGDRGDSYNYGPPASDTFVDMPESVEVTVEEAGPLRGVLRIDRTYEWPVGLSSSDRDRRSPENARVTIQTRVEVRAGEPFVRLDASFVNPSCDHRVRLHVPLGEPVSESASEGQFAVTRRGLTAEAGVGEYPLPTFPASSFVSAGDVTVLLDHVTEHELVDGGSELALTLLRAIGRLSVNVHPLRDEPAGPQLEVPGAQYVVVPVSARLAVLPSRGGWAGADAVRHAEEFRNDLLTAHGAGRANDVLPRDVSGLSVSGDGVTVSSVRPVPGGVEVRVVAMSDDATAAMVSGPFAEARRTDLLGRPHSDLDVRDGKVDVALGPWEIATLVVSGP